MENKESVENWKFINNSGTFLLNSPNHTSYLYFPLANEAGMMSSITPDLKGDIKTGQNTFLLQPISAEELHTLILGRDFWFYVQNRGPWSISGNSAYQKSLKFSNKEEKVVLKAGLLWHRVIRSNLSLGIKTEITNFVPITMDHIELMEVKITNIGEKELIITPTTSYPLFCRSADNIRDHKHVTSLLNKIYTLKDGILVKPTLSFDERGHKKNVVSYGIFGSDDDEDPPIGYFPVIEDFIGEGGSFDWPKAVVKNSQNFVLENTVIEGFEVIGALRFKKLYLPEGGSSSFRFAFIINKEEKNKDYTPYLSKNAFKEAFQACKEHWKKKAAQITFSTNDKTFSNWMRWVSIQPTLRRIFGCSFLPHHDYGRGGRGWRDLWQDCLTLLLIEPKSIKYLLLGNFAGIRFDGSNATIIGSKSGEFIADRNNIPRVWMDHGVWPFLATKLYLDQTGDLDFLLENQTYFKDKHIYRCKLHDKDWSIKQGTNLLTSDGSKYKGTIIEHLLIQHLSSFFHVGPNNNILLEGADWNDGLDMAREKGESVAFTSFYAGNLKELAEILVELKDRKDITEIELAEELVLLLDIENNSFNYSSWEQKRGLLETYFKKCSHKISGNKISVNIDAIILDLKTKADSLITNIRYKEWITNDEGFSWFNGYYDNNGKALEGDHPKGVRMTLTGQVFPIMCKIATKKQLEEVIHSINRYLWDDTVNGIRLNTNFHEILLSMGRCFGFAYGNKENGAMFNHMAIMYAYSLYIRGKVGEGFKILDSIYRQSIDFNMSRIYPGIPEYFNQRGRGMYHYLTGSASWLIFTMLTRVFGIRGKLGDLVLEPKLLLSQFDKNGEAMVQCFFAERKISIKISNPLNLDYGSYKIDKVRINNKEIRWKNYRSGVLISRREILETSSKENLEILVELGISN